MAGLDPAIHGAVWRGAGRTRVDARNKFGHDAFGMNLCMHHTARLPGATVSGAKVT
jgi:hypothetical protein